MSPFEVRSNLTYEQIWMTIARLRQVEIARLRRLRDEEEPSRRKAVSLMEYGRRMAKARQPDNRVGV